MHTQAVVDDAIYDIDQVAAVDLTALLMRLRTLFFDKAWRPPLPPTAALEIMRLAKSSRADVKKIGALFASEPLLAAQVHARASSALYGGVSVPNIHDAIVRLGLDRLHDIVLEVAMQMKVWKSAELAPWMDRIRTHSVAVGHVARVAAPLFGVHPDTAFFAGLVHDIGSAAVLSAVGERRSGPRATFNDVDLTALAAAMDELHLEVGGLIASAWHLSPSMTQVIGAHHHVPDDVAEPKLAAVLVLAEALAVDAGFDASPPDGPLMDPVVETDLASARRVLDVDDARLARLSSTLTPMLQLLRES